MRRPSDSLRKRAAEADAKTVEAAAVRLLARREHSVEELRRKLLTKGYPPETLESVIQKLAGKRLVRDERFISAFVHHHAKRGQGPVRIRAELRQQGIADSQVDEALRSAGFDWVQLAREVRRASSGRLHRAAWASVQSRRASFNIAVSMPTSFAPLFATNQAKRTVRRT